MSRPALFRALGLAGLAALTLVGCGKSDDDAVDTDVVDSDTSDTVDTDGGDTDTTEAAQVRVVHASPDAPAVSLWSGDTKIADDLAYGDVTPFVELPPGTYDVDLRVAGATASDTIVYTASFTVGAGDVVTAVAAGSLASEAADSRFRVLAFAHGFADPGAGNAAVRLVHLSPDAPTVGLDVGNDDPASPDIAGFDRWEDSGPAGVALPAGTKLRVGVAAGGETVTSFTIPPALEEGDAWFVLATGFLGSKAYAPDGFELLAISPDGVAVPLKQDPRVFALHASPDAPAVDLFVGDAEIDADLAYGDLDGLQVEPGTYTVDLFAAAAGSTRPAGDPAYSATLTVVAGQEVLALAHGFLGAEGDQQSFRIAAIPADFAQDAAGGLIQLFHASGDTPEVDVGPLSGGDLSAVLFDDVAFGEASSVVELSAGTYDLGASVGNDASAELGFYDVPVSGSEQAWAIATGSLENVGGNGVAVWLVDTKPVPWTIASVPSSCVTCLR